MIILDQKHKDILNFLNFIQLADISSLIYQKPYPITNSQLNGHFPLTILLEARQQSDLLFF